MEDLKIDINFLDKPLYFQNQRFKGDIFIWEDVDGYTYQSINPPDHVDMLILLYTMLRSQSEGYKTEIYLSRYEILKGCGLDTRWTGNYARLEESLERWKGVSIKFKGTFYDGKDYISIGFGIIDTYKIDRENKRVFVRLNKEWLFKIKQSQFFKYINFELYKALKRPVSRRLYEILCKTFYGGNEWRIKATKLGAKLGLSKRKVSTKQGEREVLYASDVIVAIKPAVCEINGLIDLPSASDKAGRGTDLFTVEYRTTGQRQDRVIHFKKTTVITQTPQKDKQAITSNVQQPGVDDTEATAIFQDALSWLGTIPNFSKSRKDEIAAIPPAEIAQYYPKIRELYDQLTKKGKQPKPGWVYKAFIEAWDFPDESHPNFFDTPEGERSREAKKIYHSWDKDSKREFWLHMSKFFTQNDLCEQNLAKMKENGTIWYFWAPKLMEELGYTIKTSD